MKFIEEERYGLTEIKEAILNPLSIFQNILGIELDDTTPYLKILYNTLYELFGSLFMIDIFEDSVDSILNKNGIDTKKISKVMKSSNKLNMFLQVMDILKFDIDKLHIVICRSVHEGDNANIIMYNLNKLLKNISIDEESIYSELQKVTIFENKNNLVEVTKLIAYRIHFVIDTLLNPNKEREEKKMKVKSDKIQTEWKIDEYGNIMFDIVKKDTLKANNTKDKREKEEIRNQVNKLDKNQGVKLKNPKDTIDDEYEYCDVLNSIRMALTKLVLILNQVDESNYITYNEIFGDEIKNIKVNKKFKGKSIWFDEFEYSPDDIRFKIRFLTFLSSFVIKHLKDIADICYIINDDGEFIEYESKVDYLHYTTERLCDLICNMLMNLNYGDDLLYFSEIFIYLDITSDTLKKNLKKARNLREQTDILKFRLRKFSGADQDVSMDTLIKLSYMVATTDPKIKGIFDFPEGYKFYKGTMTKQLVQDLGNAIMHSRKNWKIPEMFKFFAKSDPLLFSRWRDINFNDSLLVGTIALYFYSFVVNDKRIRSRISSLLEF